MNCCFDKRQMLAGFIPVKMSLPTLSYSLVDVLRKREILLQNDTNE